MTPQARFRRIGWLAALGLCIALYGLLHLKVNAVHSQVVRAERQIVALEEENLLLETEFLTRSNQVQLASWNRVDFGLEAPRADQFIGGSRQLAAFSAPRGADAPPPIRLAGMTEGEDAAPFPQLVSPLTGEPVDAELVEANAPDTGRLAVVMSPATLRVPLAAAVEARLP